MVAKSGTKFGTKFTIDIAILRNGAAKEAGDIGPCSSDLLPTQAPALS